MTWLRRLLRRAPAHLRGRVPVDCGVGTEPADAAWIASQDRLHRYLIPDEAECTNHGLPTTTVQRAADQHAQHWPEDDARMSAQRRIETPNEAMRRRNNTGPVGFYGPPDALLSTLGLTREDVERARCKHRSEDDALTSAKRKAMVATDAGRFSVQVTPEEYAAVLHDTAAHRWVAHVGTGDVHLYGVRLEVRPAPADNARRYTQEEATW